MHLDREDIAAWREFVSSDGHLTREQILRFEDILELNCEICEWAVSLLGMSGGELIETYGCRGTPSDRAEAQAFLEKSDECQRRLIAMADLVRAAGLRVQLALCERDNCPASLAAACGNPPN